MKILRDPASHRKADQMRLFGLEAVEHPDRIAGEIAEVERSFVVF